MPPTTRYTEEIILDEAFALLRAKGVESITARNVAAALGCSTGPVFTQFASMDELLEKLIDRVIAYFFDALRTPSEQNDPLVAAGVGWLRFAAEEPRLYEALFLRPHPWANKWGPVKKIMADEMKTHASYRDIDTKTRRALVGRIAIVLHGLGLELWSGRLDARGDYVSLIEQLVRPVVDVALARGWSEDFHARARTSA